MNEKIEYFLYWQNATKYVNNQILSI